MCKKRIGVFVDSLRHDSYTRKLAECMIRIAPPSFDIKIIKIEQLPLYNQNYDEVNPKEYEAFRATVKALDAVLFITPEHNRSIPAALKNALDVASRPWGQNIWGGKPGAIISESTNVSNGAATNHHLRQVLSFLQIPVLQHPECHLNNILEAMGEDGRLTSDRAVQFLQNFMDAYANWVNLICSK